LFPDAPARLKRSRPSSMLRPAALPPDALAERPGLRA
jgi:hypothetical protein